MKATTHKNNDPAMTAAETIRHRIRGRSANVGAGVNQRRARSEGDSDDRR